MRAMRGRGKGFSRPLIARMRTLGNMRTGTNQHEGTSEDDVDAIPYACAVLLIGGLVRFTDSWSLTSSLRSRVGHRLATLVDSTRESILALRCNFWWLQRAQSWPR